MKWDYRAVHIQATRWTSTGLPGELGEDFQRWGSEGWELLTVEPILRGGIFMFGFGSASRTHAMVAFFRRPGD